MKKLGYIIFSVFFLYYSHTIFSYSWDIVDLFREKVRDAYLVGNIWYHDGDEYKFEGRDNAVAHFFTDYQNDPATSALFQGGIIFPILTNKQIPETYSQINLFYLHSKPFSVKENSEVMVGGKVSLGIWEYYEQNGAPAVIGDTYLEFGFGYISSSYYSPFVFYGALNEYAKEKALSDKYDRFYYEINIPILNITSYYKMRKSGKDIPGLGIATTVKKDLLEYFEIIAEKYSKDYNVRVYGKGLLGWFNIEGEYFTGSNSFYYGTFGIEHLFLIRGDAKGETAYFSKKYAWGIGFYIFGGYYDATKDPAIEYNFTKGSDFPYTFGAGISTQMPFMIFVDSALLVGGAVLTVSAFLTDIPLFLVGAILGIQWDFYLTRLTFSLEGALINDIGAQWERDVWKDSVVWCQFSLGAHYNDRESITRTPSFFERESKTSDVFYYFKLDVFF